MCTDGEYSGERGKSDWPVTLPPRLLKDGFAIQPTKVFGILYFAIWDFAFGILADVHLVFGTCHPGF